jgi:hypothetical protein
MSLSERLRKAEQDRTGAADPGAEVPAYTGLSDPVIDLSTGDAPVLDLTTPVTSPLTTPVWIFSTDGAGSAEGIGYDSRPVRDPSNDISAIGSTAGERSTATPCPQCGGPTRLDMFDQVNQQASRSCLSCFHMFRVGV